MTDHETALQQEALANLGIAVKEATARFAGKYPLYIKSLTKYVTGIVNDGIADVAEARAMDNEELRRYVHSLKGVCANLSINDAYHLLIDIEQSVSEDRIDFDKYEQMRVLLAETARAVLAILVDGDVAAAPPPLPAGPEDECRVLLRELAASLRMGQARESEAIARKLSAQTWENVNPSLIKEIYLAVDDYRYDRAMELINEV